MRTILLVSSIAFLFGIGFSGSISSEQETAGAPPNAVPSDVDRQDTLRAYTESIPGTLVEFEMVPVPAGSVSVDGVQKSVGPFWMAAMEVRWDAYDTYRLDEEMEALDDAEADAISLPSKPYGFGNKIPGFGQEGYPALAVTRHAAQEYARWLSAHTEHTYRLPTAAEWKHACRLGHDAPQDLPPDALAEYAWYEGNANGEAHPTASLDSSDLGLYDQLGNAAEHVAPPEDDDDQTPTAWGGSYRSPADEVHCSARLQKTAAWQESDPQLPKSKWWLSDAPFVGFRVVRTSGSGGS